MVIFSFNLLFSLFHQQMKFTLWLTEIELAQGLIHLRMRGEDGLTEMRVQKKRQISVCLSACSKGIRTAVCVWEKGQREISRSQKAILVVPLKERLGLKRKKSPFIRPAVTTGK